MPSSIAHAQAQGTIKTLNYLSKKNMEAPNMQQFLDENAPEGTTVEDIVQAPDDFMEQKRGEVKKAIELLENNGYKITK